MEFKELTTAKFLGATSVKHSVSWSEDDKVAVITQKGVNVLDMCLSRTCSQGNELDFTRGLIVPPPHYPTYETGIKTDEVFVRAEREQVFEMMMNPLLYPGLKMTEQQPPITLQVAWSSAGLADFQGCLLATRQSSGSVSLLLRKKNSWLTVVDVSQLWVQHLRTIEWPREKSTGKEIFAILSSRVKQIEATAVAWSQLVREGSCCWSLLLVAHRDCSVAAWRVTREDTDIRASLAFKLSIDMGRICHLSWHPSGDHQGLLVVGDVRGVVKSVLVSDVLTAHTAQHEAREVWGEKDLIAVSDSVAGVQAGVWLLAVVKGSCLVALAMSSTGKHLAKTIANLGTLDISGITSLLPGTVLLCTQCGGVSKIVLTYSTERQELELECLEMPAKFETANFNLQGLAASRNKTIFAAALTACTPYDHLCLREPTQVVFFTYSTFEEVWGELEKQTVVSSLYHSLDQLELIRLLGRTITWEVDLSALESKARKNPRLAWWLTLLKQMDPKNPNPNLASLQSRLESLILCTHICRTLNRLRTGAQVELSALEGRSAALMLHWLRDFAGTEWGGHVPPELLKMRVLEEQPETCNICGEKVQFRGPAEARCDAGHTLPRCSISLLQCSSAPLRTCRTCKLVAMDKPVFGLDPECVYCCRPLERDECF